MRDGTPKRIGAAVIGTGFIGAVHAGAIARIGGDLRGILGSTPERGEARADAMGAPRAYPSLQALLDDPSVDVVHVASPNHLHHAQVMAALEAGKHVVCEKPLAVSTAQSAEMVAAARASGRVCAVCFNIRFYPLNQHAHGLVAAGGLGAPRLVTGHYHQDWLARDTDWNWRLTTDRAGPTRAVGDIGAHWIDLTSFILGARPVQVLAEMATFMPLRQAPIGPVATFAVAEGATEPRAIDTEDAAQVLLRYADGARGACTISQVSMGRKNAVHWDVAGSEGSAAWDSETPDYLFLGHRDRPNEVLQRDPGLMNAPGAAAARMPGGHVEGFADTFAALFAQVYGDVRAGGRQAASTYAGFADGHWVVAWGEAVAASARAGAWTRIEP